MKRTIMLFFLIMSILAACSPAMAITPPEGQYQRVETTNSGPNTLTITLKQGHFDMANSSNGDLWLGTYQVKGDEILFTEEKDTQMGHAFCPSKSELSFTYQWSYDQSKKVMVLKPLQDTCDTRAGGANNVPWTYKG